MTKPSQGLAIGKEELGNKVAFSALISNRLTHVPPRFVLTAQLALTYLRCHYEGLSVVIQKN